MGESLSFFFIGQLIGAKNPGCDLQNMSYACILYHRIVCVEGPKYSTRENIVVIDPNNFGFLFPKYSCHHIVDDYSITSFVSRNIYTYYMLFVDEIAPAVVVVVAAVEKNACYVHCVHPLCEDP